MDTFWTLPIFQENLCAVNGFFTSLYEGFSKLVENPTWSYLLQNFMIMVTVNVIRTITPTQELNKVLNKGEYSVVKIIDYCYAIFIWNTKEYGFLYIVSTDLYKLVKHRRFLHVKECIKRNSILFQMCKKMFNSTNHTLLGKK